jgi:hypothetical protein
MQYLVGIDDTDNLESRGTGHMARCLSETFAAAGFDPLGVTRHQLLVDRRIPYTSHNSSACIDVRGAERERDRLIDISRDFLRSHAAPGSDVGLCIVAFDTIDDAAIEFGGRAKRAIVTESEARGIADALGAHLEPLTGTGLGVIGALAGVGLRAGGNDGRFLWLPHLRDMSGVHDAATIRARVGLDAIETEDGYAVGGRDRIDLGTWSRPVLRGGRSVLLVQEAESEDYDWVVAAKERIKQLSE